MDGEQQSVHSYGHLNWASEKEETAEVRSETSPAAAIAKGYSLWAPPLPHSYPRLEKTQLSARCHQHLEYQASDADKNKLCAQARVINTFRMLGESFLLFAYVDDNKSKPFVWCSRVLRNPRGPKKGRAKSGLSDKPKYLSPSIFFPLYDPSPPTHILRHTCTHLPTSQVSSYDED